MKARQRFVLSLHCRNRNEEDGIARERGHLLPEEKDFFIQEAYKTLRTNVLFSLAGEEDRVLLVTSSLQGEGKSITASNLAFSFAQDGRKVLLVDCDLRRPKLGRLMGLHSGLGLSNILLKPELCGRALQETTEKNLKVLLAGDIPPNPSELLGSQRMGAFLEEAKKEFDLIILDTPPVNVVTDAMVLCPQADGVLFVVRAGSSERGAVMRAVDLLKRSNARLLGFVMNGVEGQSGSYGKYRRGSYGYGYDSASLQGDKA